MVEYQLGLQERKSKTFKVRVFKCFLAPNLTWLFSTAIEYEQGLDTKRVTKLSPKFLHSTYYPRPQHDKHSGLTGKSKRRRLERHLAMIK
jgi:hypothetical protein